MAAGGLAVLLVTADRPLAERLAAGLARGAHSPQVAVAPALDQARRKLEMHTPAVIFLDESLLGDEPCEEVAREFSRHAPVVVAVDPAHQAALVPLVSMGEADCVARAGDFLSLVLALIDRRLRWTEHSAQYEEALTEGEPIDFGSILRHELNNPLTGILGNAELLLAHRQKLPREAILRLETIADLAVRLRETVRRISNAWEARQRHAGGG